MKEKVKKPLRKKWWFWVVVVIFAIGIIGSFGEEEKTETVDAEPQAEEATTNAKDEPKEEVKEEPKEEVKPLTVDEQIKADINKKLGKKTNNDRDRIVSLTIEQGDVQIVLAADDSLTANLTRDAMLFDAADAFPILFKDDSIQQVSLTYQLPLVDQYGKEFDGDVMKISLSRETNDKIVWENFLVDNFATVAENFYLHPAIQEK